MNVEEYDKKFAFLERRQDRERKARKSAENILEQKSLDLYELNQSLLKANLEMQKLSVAVMQSPTAIIITDIKGHIEYTNPMFTTLTGWQFTEVKGKHTKMLGSGLTPTSTYQDLWQTIQKGDVWKGEIYNQKKNGEQYLQSITISPIFDDKKNILHFLSNSEDITLRKEYEERIHHLAHYDALTGLLNRFSLHDFMDSTLAKALRDNTQLAVLFLDLDNFKSINDSHGHKIGDELLIQLSKRLKAITNEQTDLVARLGGDEFVIVLSKIKNPSVAAIKAKEILEKLAAPFELDGQDELVATTSIGISVFPSDGDATDALLKHADTAMYHVKANGRSNYEFFTFEMNKAVEERIMLTKDLRQALINNELELYYQPKICVKKRSVSGIEALVRWNHAELGFISPEKFIPIAEESDLILLLGDWVMKTAFKKILDLHKKGFTQLKMAINISAKQLEPEGFIKQVSDALTLYQVDSDMIEFEITESAAMTDPKKSISRLHKLRELGIELAIDDFGTGYSSLAYLKTLPIQILKIDKSFIMNLEIDEDNAAISKATIALAHSLGYKVVAEGVEIDFHEKFLTKHECDILQGYFYSKPIPASELEAFITNFKM